MLKSKRQIALPLILIFTLATGHFFVEVSAQTPVRQEVLEGRTYTSKVAVNEDGSYTLRTAHTRLHYMDNGTLLDVDLTPTETQNSFTFDKADFGLVIKKSFSQNNLISFTNRFDGANHSIELTPENLVYINPTTKDAQLLRAKQNVDGTFNVDDTTVTYTDAYGTGIDYVVAINNTGFDKYIVFNEFNEVVPGGFEHILIPHKTTKSSSIKNLENGLIWDEQTEFTGKEFYFDDVHRTTIPFGRIWSAEETEVVDINWYKQGNSLYMGKTIPISFLQNNSFPIYTDSKFDTYDSTNSKQVTNDNCTDSYNTCANAATGDAVYTLSGGLANVIHDSSITNWYIRKADLQFDTSAIPIESTITSSAIVTDSTTGTTDTNGYTLYFLDNTNNSNLSNPLVTEDFNDFEVATTSAIGSKTFAAYDADGLATTTFSTFDHVASGTSAVTRIGMRSGNEMWEDETGGASDPTGTNRIRFTFNAPAPYMVINFTPPEIVNDIASSLINCWSLDEAAGQTRADHYGSDDMTDNNTVGTSTGKQGNAGDFELSSSQYLDNADYQGAATNDWSLSIWLNPESITASQLPFNISDGTENLYLEVQTTNVVAKIIGGGVQDKYQAAHGMSAGTWYHWVITHNGTTGSMAGYKDNSSVTNTDDKSQKGAWSWSGTVDAHIGSNIAGTSNYDGLIDEVAFYNKILTAEEINSLYANGLAANCGDLAAAPAGVTPMQGVIWFQ